MPTTLILNSHHVYDLLAPKEQGEKYCHEKAKN
jgi:hypothetical protein